MDVRGDSCARGIKFSEGTFEGTIFGVSEYHQRAQMLTIQARFRPWHQHPCAYAVIVS